MKEKETSSTAGHLAAMGWKYCKLEHGNDVCAVFFFFCFLRMCHLRVTAAKFTLNPMNVQQNVCNSKNVFVQSDLMPKIELDS